jgi:hypothetical protein
VGGVVLDGFSVEDVVCVNVYYGEGWAAPVGMHVDVDAAEECKEGPNADVVEDIYYHFLFFWKLRVLG